MIGKSRCCRPRCLHMVRQRSLLIKRQRSVSLNPKADSPGAGSYPWVPLRDVQEAASHADPRTTMRYDRARGSLDRHATYVVAAYIAGAAR